MREAVPYAMGIAFSPIPIAAILLLLTCPRATANGFSFIGGWVVGIATPALLFVVLIEQADVTDGDPLWLAAGEIALGVAFLVAAGAIWMRGRRRGPTAIPWVEAIDSFTPARSAGLGVFLAGANPKAVALSLGAALAVAESSAGTATTARYVAMFTALGAIGVSIPLTVYLAVPSRADSALRRMRAWIGRHETVLLVVLGVLIGALFVADGLGGL